MKTPRARLLALAAVATGVMLVVDHWPGKEPAAGAAKDLSDIVPAVRAAGPRAAPAPADDALDTRLIVERVAAAPAPADAFAAHSWVRPPPPAPPAPPPEPPPPPPPPQAPPLPFKYLGRLDETPERTLWYLGQGEQLFVVAVGESINGTYRIDGFEAGQLRLTYLPLDIKQSLPIGAAP